MKYNDMQIENKSAIVTEVTQLTREMISAGDIVTFNKVIVNHENIIASALGYEKVKDTYFKDYWGEVKSLGAWGGDFVLVTTDRSHQETRAYFEEKGFTTLINYTEIVMSEVQGRT